MRKLSFYMCLCCITLLLHASRPFYSIKASEKSLLHAFKSTFVWFDINAKLLKCLHEKCHNVSKNCHNVWVWQLKSSLWIKLEIKVDHDNHISNTIKLAQINSYQITTQHQTKYFNCKKHYTWSFLSPLFWAEATDISVLSLNTISLITFTECAVSCASVLLFFESLHTQCGINATDL